MNTESEWSDNWPDWGDGRKQVELLMKDGSTILGKLEIDDVGFDGEDEYPIFVVIDDKEVRHSFGLAEEWRFY